MKKLIVISLCFLLLGCQSRDIVTKTERVSLNVLNKNQLPVQNVTISLVELADPTPEIALILKPTDSHGKTEATLNVSSTYQVSLVTKNYKNQYEEFSVSENADDNVFTFTLEED